MICLEQEQGRFRAIAYNRGTKIQGNRYFLFFLTREMICTIEKSQYIWLSRKISSEYGRR